MVGEKKINAMQNARSAYKNAKKALRVAQNTQDHANDQQMEQETASLSLATAKSLKNAITMRKKSMDAKTLDAEAAAAMAAQIADEISTEVGLFRVEGFFF